MQLLLPLKQPQLQTLLVLFFVMMLPQLQSAMEELELMVVLTKLFQIELLSKLVKLLLLLLEEISPHSNGTKISLWPHFSMENTNPLLHQLTVKHGVQPSLLKLLKRQPLSLLYLDSPEKLNVLGNSKLRMDLQHQDSRWQKLISSGSLCNGWNGSPRQVLELANFSQLQMLLTIILVFIPKPMEFLLTHKKQQVWLDGLQQNWF